MIDDKYGLYIFDWDGTLSTSTTLVRLSSLFKTRYRLEEILKHKDKYSIPDLTDARGVSDYIKEYSEASMFYSNLYGLYSIFTRPRLREGSKEMLSLLRRHGKEIALFSDSKYYRLRSEIEHAKVEGDFNLVLSSELIHAYKPSPKGILLIAKELGFKVDECLYIGDMASDVMTAKFAAMDSCAVAGGLEVYRELKEAKPTYLFRNTFELYKDLEKCMS